MDNLRPAARERERPLITVITIDCDSSLLISRINLWAHRVHRLVTYRLLEIDRPSLLSLLDEFKMRVLRHVCF